MTEYVESEKGSLWMGALHSSILKWDTTFDYSKAERFYFPSFVGLILGSDAHIYVGSLMSVDISPYLAFATKEGAVRLYIYVSSVSIGSAGSKSLVTIVGALALQGRGFNPEIHVIAVGAGNPTDIDPHNSLSVVAQGEPARTQFLATPGALEALALVEEHRCKPLFVGNNLIATVLGLEVARSVNVDGHLKLEIGVGRNDRVAKSLMDESSDQSTLLAKTIETVRKFRLGDSGFHPLARLSLARWMRVVIERSPELVGASTLVPLELTRVGEWPARSIWQLTGKSALPNEDDQLYHGFESSFDDDDLSFALAVNSQEEAFLLAISGGVNLGAPAKAYEVMSSLEKQALDVKGSILVMQEKSRIASIERLAKLTNFDLSIITISPSWRDSDPN